MPHHVRNKDHRPVARTLALLILTAALVAAVSGCGPAAPPPSGSDPAARAVQKLLELRLARSPDAKAYALFFKSPSIPQSLADAAAKEATSTKPPIPQWEAPYVSSMTTSTGEVVVVWKADPAFPDHSVATVFGVEKYQGRWVVVDATDVIDKAKIPPPLNR